MGEALRKADAGGLEERPHSAGGRAEVEPGTVLGTGVSAQREQLCGHGRQAHREEALLLGCGWLQPAVLRLRVLYLLDASSFFSRAE